MVSEPPAFGIALAISYTGRTRQHRRSGIIIKFVVILGLVAVIVSLFTALYYLYTDKGHGTRMVKALAVRVALSMSLVAFLVLSYYMGWIAPTGVR